ncbi:hypothetical protein [Vibrio neonatus]|uniref:hypothetical protein n=1 Tax=Vibrio neonatus TaxID=278860 RepID=UPI0021C466DD|nr:hypothetical protein [Vibrio neonatus]
MSVDVKTANHEFSVLTAVYRGLIRALLVVHTQTAQSPYKVIERFNGNSLKNRQLRLNTS